MLASALGHSSEPTEQKFLPLGSLYSAQFIVPLLLIIFLLYVSTQILAGKNDAAADTDECFYFTEH